jgi:hypothetical protein
LELGHEKVVINFPILVVARKWDKAEEANNRSQLLTGVNLRVVSNPQLLVNEPITYGRGGDQKKGEDSNGPSPFDHSAVKYSLGAIVIAAALWAIWWGICHFIYTDNRKWVAANAFSAIIIEIACLCCGLWLMTP